MLVPTLISSSFSFLIVTLGGDREDVEGVLLSIIENIVHDIRKYSTKRFSKSSLGVFDSRKHFSL